MKYYKQIHGNKYPYGKLRTIFLDHWEKYRSENIVRPVENINVLKMLSCRTPLLGKHIYNCPTCDYTLEIPHSCKSRFCSVCGYVAMENWIRKRFSFLLNCHYHHVVVTVPSFFRWIIKQDRTLTLNLFAKLAAETIQEWTKSRGYEVGIICFFHSFGERLQFHPHFHMIVTAGGITEKNTWYKTTEKIPGHILMPRFKAKWTSNIKNLFREEKLITDGNLGKLFHQMNHIHDEHWQFYTDKITKDSTFTMLYCARYAKKMIMSEKRIINYDGNEVTFFSSKGRVLVYKVDHFIKCLIQHIPENNFRLVRYYGFYSNTSKKKYAIARATWQPLQGKREPWDWKTRQLYRNANDPEYENKRKDPFVCPSCGTELELREVIYPEPLYKRRLENILDHFKLEIQQKIKLDYG